MTDIFIRPAAPADIEFLIHGNAAMALETEHIALDLSRLSGGIQALFEDSSRGVYYIAEMDERRVGQMMITYEWSDWRNGMFWWIQSVWVEPDYRGQGIFRALYQHVEQLAHTNRGVCGLRLYVENANARAQATYVKIGMSRTVYDMFEVDFVLNRAG